jgi:hypothetical protein
LLVKVPLTLLFLSDTDGGRTPDKPIADATPYPLPAGSGLTSVGVAGVRRTPVTCAPIFRSIRRNICWRTWSIFDSTWILTGGCYLAVLGVRPLGSRTPCDTHNASPPWSSLASPPPDEPRSTGSIVAWPPCSRQSRHASAQVSPLRNAMATSLRLTTAFCRIPIRPFT